MRTTNLTERDTGEGTEKVLCTDSEWGAEKLSGWDTGKEAESDKSRGRISISAIHIGHTKNGKTATR
jgi:hypothetical protein